MSHTPADPEPGAEVLLQRMRAFADVLLQQNELDDLSWAIAAKVGELFGFEDCVVYLVEPIGLVQTAAFGVKSPALRQIKNRLVLPPGEGIVGAVAASGRAELVAETRDDPRYIADEFCGRSELAVPIVFCGKVLGVLDTESSRPAAFTAAHLATLELIASLAAPRIAAALAERQLRCALGDLERVELQQRDREAKLDQQRLESLGQLAGGIAHDFNNLLTAILGNVTLAQDAVCGRPEAALLADAATACEKARELSRQLVAFAAGGAPVLRHDDPVALLREVVAAELAGTGIEVRWRVAADLPAVSFDRGQLRECLRNLVRNAREAMRDGGQLDIGVESDGERRLVLRLADNGPGVASPLRARIFDPYFSTKEGASGLGLSVAYWIARRHGGGIELDPLPGVGARFRMWLPAQPMGGKQAGGEGGRVRPLRVLVLDDETAVREVLVRMLQSQAHVAVAVGDGVACVREFAAARQQRRPYDVVLLDLTLRHGISWDETLAALRQIGGDFLAIAISGYHDSPVMANHHEFGFVASLPKPFTAQDLAAVLRAVTRAPGAAP